MNKCPICHQEMRHQYSMANEGTVGEESQECPSGHYVYDFSYGVSRLRICGVSWMYSWDDPYEDLKNRGDAIELVIQANRLPDPVTVWVTMTLDELVRHV